MNAARSYLYVPGDRQDRFQKAFDRAGDAVIFDLEDAVAPDRKDIALDLVAGWVGAPRAPGGPQAWVRVNSGPRMAGEIAAVVGQGVAGIIIPKADAASVESAAEALVKAEGAAGIPLGAVTVAALVESARGLLELGAIATHPRVSRLMIGEADLAADLGITPSPDGRELMPLRLQLVVAAAAAGVAPPTGPVHTDVRNLEALRTETEGLRRLGFGARSAIHPDQVAVIEDVMTPSAEAVAQARQLLAAHDGRGGGLTSDGQFVDEAVLRSARRVIAIAERAGL